MSTNKIINTVLKNSSIFTRNWYWSHVILITSMATRVSFCPLDSGNILCCINEGTCMEHQLKTTFIYSTETQNVCWLQEQRQNSQEMVSLISVHY